MNNYVEPRVTAIITTIGSSYVRKAIESVKAQTYKNIEIIVCYDGNNFENFKNEINNNFSEIKLLNVGPFNNANNARQTGINESSGEYIALLDDDDYWNENHIDLNVKYTKFVEAEDFVLVSNSIIISDGKEKVTLPQKYFNQKKESVADYLFNIEDKKKTIMQTSSLFFNKKLGTDIPFKTNLTLHQDYDWVIRVNEANIPIIQTRENTSYYVHNSTYNSISKKSKAKESIAWGESVLLNYSESTRKGFLRNNTIWMLRSENFFNLLKLIFLGSKKMNLKRKSQIELIVLGMYTYVRNIIK